MNKSSSSEDKSSMNKNNNENKPSTTSTSTENHLKPRSQSNLFNCLSKRKESVSSVNNSNVEDIQDKDRQVHMKRLKTNESQI